MVLSLKNISKSFGVNEIFNNISFHIEHGDKMALIGVNGAGKTTLFKIMTGELSHDSGEIRVGSNLRLGYMAQMHALEENNNIYEELLTVFNDLIQLENSIESLSHTMPSLKGAELDAAMEKYSALNEEFEAKNGYEYKSRVKGVINGLGFRNTWEKPIKILSGGQKTRVSLGKLLLSNPDLLLLDEPTNHLDIDSIQWLEDFLRNFSKSIIVISHDRYFLDRVANKVVEIENKKAKQYGGNYTHYVIQKEIDRKIELKHFTDQQKNIKKQEESIKLLKSFNREKSIKRAQSKEKALEKMDKIDKPENLPEKMRINLSPKLQSGNEVLTLKGVSKSFGNTQLFKNVSFEIKKGDKVALIGPNGIGKTTLFRIIMNSEETIEGTVEIGHKVVIGYYDQHQQNLDPYKTIFDEISDAYPELKAGEIRNNLAAFVFRGDDVYKKIGDLSGGEKGRVSLSKIMLTGANFLLLDEPTNHLDMYSKEILEEALASYEGTMLYISHDRYFINRTANKIIELTPSGAVLYLGNYDYYLEKKKASAVYAQTHESVFKESDNRDNWLKKKEEDAIARKKKNRIKKIQKEIKDLESQLEEINYSLNDANIYTDHVQAQEFYDLKEQTEDKLLMFYEELETL